MELFTRDILPNYKLFHGSNQLLSKNSLINKTMWFSNDINQAFNYGKNIYSFQIIKPIKLLDICSPIFQMHYLNEINNSFYDLQERMKYLFQLGLPNYDIQSKFVGSPNCVFNNIKQQNHILYKLNFNNNINRFSYGKNGKLYDLDMINMFNKIYGNKGFDGYISEQYLPSVYHCGSLQPEICLFNLNSLLFEGKIKELRGGNKKNKIIRNKTKLKKEDDPYEIKRLCDYQSIEEYQKKIDEELERIDKGILDSYIPPNVVIGPIRE